MARGPARRPSTLPSTTGSAGGSACRSGGCWGVSGGRAHLVHGQHRHHRGSARPRTARAGFGSLKVKVGGAEDLERLEAVRSGNRRPLARGRQRGLDARLGRRADAGAGGLGVELVEQPFPRRRPVIPFRGCRSSSRGRRWWWTRAATTSPTWLQRPPTPTASTSSWRSPAASRGCADDPRRPRVGLHVMLGCMVESQLGVAPAVAIASLADWVDLDGHLLLADEPTPACASTVAECCLATAPGSASFPRAPRPRAHEDAPRDIRRGPVRAALGQD